MMFRRHTPAYFRTMTFKSERDNGESSKIIVCSFDVQPFTNEMANELDADIRAELFSLSTGEIKPKLKAVDFALDIPLCAVEFRMIGEDTMKPSLLLRNVKIEPILAVRRDKEAPVFNASFRLNAQYPSAKELLWLADNITNQLFLTFEREQTDALDDGEREPELKKTKQPDLVEETVN